MFLVVMLLTLTLAHLQTGGSTEERDAVHLLQRSTLLDLSPGQDIRAALHNHSGSGESLFTVMSKVPGFEQAPFHKALALLQTMHPEGSFFGLPVLFVAVSLLIVATYNRTLGPHPETSQSPPSKTQVPAIPGLHLPQVEVPYEALQSARPMASSQRSLDSAQQSLGQLPHMRPMLGSQSSIMSGTSRSASYSPRQSFAEPRLSPYAIAVTAAEAAPSGDMHYNMMTAGNSAASITSGRTPSPFRNSTTASAILSPRYSTMSRGGAPIDRLPPLSLSQSTPRGAVNFLRPTPRAVLQAPREVRASTASQEGLQGVRGRVQWFNVNTPRPPEGRPSRLNHSKSQPY